MDWSSMFGPSAPLLEAFVRGTVMYLVLFVFMRVIGQRESGALGLTDVLLVVLVAEAAAVGLHGAAESITDALVVVAAILFWSVVLDALAYRFPRLAPLLKARPRTLIRNGVLNRKVMRREFMNEDEVLSQLRLHGIEDIAEVERACL
jgi:uncharacterized membrane protein YcaP (DUF421 family)